MKNRALIRAIIVLALAVIAGLIALFMTYTDKPVNDTVNYSIHIYTDGTATISVDNIGNVIQLEEDTQYGAGYYLRAGTLIIPGDGSQIEFEYPRRDSLRMED